MHTHMLLWHYGAVPSPRDRVLNAASGPGWLAQVRRVWRLWGAARA